ncbi:MAG: TonB-dependent receptor [Alistipes sp.]|nr:TonB-dependent receptor [Alistipes sp.]
MRIILLRNTSRLLLLLMAVCWTTVASAQDRQVSGVVTDEDNQLIVGATVILQGTTTGTTTNVEGRYTISVPAGAVTLQFGYLGMETLEADVSATTTTLNITLKSDAVQVDDVVVVGYGTQRKRDLTGAISTVGGAELANIPITDAASALQGKVAGVTVTTAEGSPDAEIKIRIRGGGSITQDNSPLYIVDGFPVTNFSDISIGDIESMTILKDASSTAIYGARGANGVVLITTKQGKVGSTQVTFNAYWGVNKIANTLDVLDPYEYVLWQYELGGESGQAYENVKRFYGNYDDFELYKNQKGYDWQKEVFGRSALTQNYNINVSGGSEKTRYSIGLSRVDNEGIMINSGMSRNNISLNLNTRLNDHWSIDFNSRFSNYTVNGVGTSGENTSTSFLQHAIQYPTTDGLESQLETLPSGADIETLNLLTNPVLVAQDNIRKQVRNTTTFNAAVSYRFLENFVVRSEWGTDFLNQKNKQYYGPNSSQAKADGAGNPIVTIGDYDYNSYRIANTLTYDVRNLGGRHHINAMLGQETTSATSKTYRYEFRSFPSGLTSQEAFAMLAQGSPEPAYSYESPANNLVSFFGRVNYSLDDRYILSATFRADGSSKFAKGNRWGYFPSVALAWRMSDERFLSSASWLTDLKLRASLGSAGNNRIGDDLWKLIYSTDKDGSYYSYGSGSETIANLLRPGSVLSNPDLKWETTITRNIGVDGSFFNNRLSTVIDLYYNTTKNLLISASIPSSTGYSTQMQNIGKTSNRGIEISLDGTMVQTRDWHLSASFNIAFNRNRVEKLGGEKTLYYASGWYGTQSPAYEYIVQEGKSVGLMYGFVTDGMYSFDDFNYDAGTGVYTLKDGVASSQSHIAGRNFGPGSLKFKDVNEDGVIDEKDLQVIGNATPKHTGGFSLSAGWKGIDLTAQFNWSYGNKVYNANKLHFTTFVNSRTFQNLLQEMNSGDRFTTVDITGEYTGKAGTFVTDPTILSQMNANATIWSPMMTSLVMHSWAVEDGSFLRLNNVTLGYTLPQKWTQKARIRTVRFYVSGYNLHVWTKYSGYDPEVDVFSSNPLTPNVDYSAYPRSRTFVGGINITF